MKKVNKATLAPISPSATGFSNLWRLVAMEMQIILRTDSPWKRPNLSSVYAKGL